MEMYNPNVLVWVLGLEELCNKATMALFRSILCAKEATIVKVLDIKPLSDMSVLQNLFENYSVSIPINYFILIILQKLFCGSQIRDMLIFCVADCSHEELKVGSLCEAGKLTCVVNSYVHKFANASIFQQFEEFLSILLGKANSV